MLAIRRFLYLLGVADFCLMFVINNRKLLTTVATEKTGRYNDEDRKFNVVIHGIEECKKGTKSTTDLDVI